MSSSELPTTGSRTTVDHEIKAFLASNPDLHLGGEGDLTAERSHHTKVFGFHNLPQEKQAPIHSVEFTAIRGPHGTIPLRLFYPSSGEERCKTGEAEARLPFDTPAATENNSGLYLECDGIFSFANNYLPRGTAPAHPYVSPGMQPLEFLRSMPPAVIFTRGFDPLRDVGVEYGTKLKKAGNEVEWHHFDSLTHGFLQMAPWSKEAMNATKLVGKEMRRLAYDC